MASYNTSDFKKGFKVQIDGDPYIMIECNFVKPGKGNALYKCKLRNLVRGTQLDRTYKGGDSLEAADVEEIDAQYLYQQGDRFVFMDNENFEQYELTKEQTDDAWKWLKEGMVCKMILFNNNPDLRRGPEPRRAEDRLLRAGHSRQHGDQPDQAGQAGNRGRSHLPGLRRNRRHDQGRHAHRRISGTRAGIAAASRAASTCGATGPFALADWPAARADGDRRAMAEGTP